MNKSPLAILKERFGDDRKAAKDKLVKAVRDAAGADVWVERLNATKGLSHVSNRKLLHLEEVLTTVKKEVGSREKLIGELLSLTKRDKDSDFKAGLEAQSTPRLWDALQARRRNPDKKPRQKQNKR